MHCVMCDLLFLFLCGKEKSSTPEHTIEEDKTCEGTKNFPFLKYFLSTFFLFVG